MIASTRIYKQNTRSLLPLCTAIITCVLLRDYPPYCADNTFAQQNAGPKIEFQSPYWDAVFDQAKSFIRRLATLDWLHLPTAHDTWRSPWLTATTARHAIPRRSLPHSHNWSPRAKWHSVLTRAANNYLHIVAQAPLKEEQGDLYRGDTMSGSFEPVHRKPSFPWTEVVGKDFLTLLHVK